MEILLFNECGVICLPVNLEQFNREHPKNDMWQSHCIPTFLSFYHCYYFHLPENKKSIVLGSYRGKGWLGSILLLSEHRSSILLELSTILCKNQAIGGTSYFSLIFFALNVFNTSRKQLKSYLNLPCSIYEVDIFLLFI